MVHSLPVTLARRGLGPLPDDAVRVATLVTVLEEMAVLLGDVLAVARELVQDTGVAVELLEMGRG